MKRTFLLLFSLLMLMSKEPTFSQNQHVLPGVPLIDREIFFDTPQISGGKLSPDGKWISFMKEYKGIINIWVKKFDDKFEDSRPLTDNERPIGGYFWTKDGKYILYVKDNKGDENYNIYAVEPHAQANPETGVPVSRNLSPMKDVRVQIYQVSEKNPNILWIGINNRDKSWHDLYKLDISTGELTLFYENTNRITGWNFDWDENVRLAYRTNEDGFSEILRVEKGDKFTKIYETNLQESAYVAAWNKDNTKMYLVSNKGDVNFTTLYLMDPVSLNMEKIESDPKNRVDFGGAFFDKHTREMIYTAYLYDKDYELLWKNKKWEDDYTFLKQKFPGREIGYSSMTDDYKQMLITLSGDKYVSETYYFNTETRELIYQYTPRPKLKEYEKYLVAMTPITYKSSDGLEIPAYLSTPYGMEAKNLPLVVMPHGGPKGPRDTWGFNSYVQILCNRGYAVMLPNFRASGGYGKAFLNAGDKQWGKLMQDDITYGVNYLIEQGIVDKNRVGIMGGSYGGYATLAGLTFTPDMYACGVDIVGPSNLFTLMESIPAYWEAARKSLYEMVGNPETEEGKKLLHDASPLFHVNNIVKPLLIVQGANDPRVKQAESDQIVIAMRDNQKDVEYILADDEGHGFHKPVNNMAMWVAVEKFLAKYLDGRYQESAKPEVLKRLQEITQDISKVTYNKPKTVSAVTALPALADDLQAGSFGYQAEIAVQGQTLKMDMTRTIEKEGDMWKITEVSSSPMGEARDEMYLKEMMPVKRIASQAGQTVEMNIVKNKVSIEAMGKTSEMEFTGVFLPVGPGFDMIVARLPLRKDYEISFNDFDFMTQKMKLFTLKVLGEEGNAWKVQVYNPENEKETTTYWIDKSARRFTKSEQTVPALGNAVITTTEK